MPFGRLAVAVVASVLALATSPAESSDDIALYFDLQTRDVCVETPTYPLLLTAYLVVEDCSSSAGICGWECAVEFASSLHLLAADLGPEALNVASLPDFIVTFGTPRPQAGSMVLATFSLFATDATDIYLHAVSSRGISSSFRPMYSTAEDGRVSQVELNYSYGTPFHPVAAIGTANCPVRELDRYRPRFVAPTWTILDTSSVRLLASANADDDIHDESPVDTAAIDWEWLYQVSELGIRGRILDRNLECVETRQVRLGVAHLVLVVDEVYWGSIEGMCEVWVWHVSVPNCIEYLPARKYPTLADFAEDAVIDVFPIYRDGHLESNEYTTFPSTRSRTQPSELAAWRQESYKSVATADLVALLAPQDSTFSSYRLVAIYQTSQFWRPGDVLTVSDGHFNALINIEYHQNPEAVYLCALDRQADGSFRRFDHFQPLYVVGPHHGVETLTGMAIRTPFESGELPGLVR